MTTNEGSDQHTLVEREELRKLTADAVSDLPYKQRLICSLYYYDELTMREIGGIVGISEARVSQLHTKVMLKLRQKLETKLNGNGYSQFRRASSLDMKTDADKSANPYGFKQVARKKAKELTSEDMKRIIELRRTYKLSYIKIGDTMNISPVRAWRICRDSKKYGY